MYDPPAITTQESVKVVAATTENTKVPPPPPKLDLLKKKLRTSRPKQQAPRQGRKKTRSSSRKSQKAATSLIEQAYAQPVRSLEKRKTDSKIFLKKETTKPLKVMKAAQGVEKLASNTSKPVPPLKLTLDTRELTEISSNKEKCLRA